MVDDVKDSGVPAKRTHKSIDTASYFKGFFANDHHAYIAQKAERLSTAVHLVTGFIPKEEPVRTLLRAGSLELSQWSTDLTRLAAVGPAAFGARCAELSSMLETAQSSGLVSPMNAKLIVEEYAKLAEFVKDRYGFIRSQSSDIKDNFEQGDFKGHKDINRQRTNTESSIKDTQRASSRRADILALFKSKDRISIKDAVDAIHGVSEKTLQRELLGMVADRMLIKEGERRWSTYIKTISGSGGALL